ncbi:glucuronoxylan 4-O-methyltransferase 1-like [Typha latifolia]|uniref:glucuronoxylan 4-O-methyltransferase 1-like n=1 Tax=Typha latifolia TaxID=4733 RepID=UPI003C2F2281
MRSKIQGTFYLKPTLIALFLFFTVFFMLKLNDLLTSPLSNNYSERQSSSSHCTKIPEFLADTIIHYTTSSITPQQKLKEINVTARVLREKSPCNFLVFGLGHDSPMWSALNYGGRTVFLEEDGDWIETVRLKFPTLESYHVTYDTKVRDAEELLGMAGLPACTTVGDVRSSRCVLALRSLPEVVYEREWDVIMVDAPTGYQPGAPGRMGAIYTAGMAARWRTEGRSTDVFVHDVNRYVEDEFSKKLLCEGYMRQEEGILRHFTIPSHRGATNMGKTFCP